MADAQTKPAAYRRHVGRGGQTHRKAVAGRTRLPLAGAATVEFDEVFHIGTLRQEDKGKAHGSSWEGHGLSISLDPGAWELIAKLGGAPWWRLRRSGGRFLDYWQLSAEERLQISAWAVKRGLAQWTRAWRLSYFDDELDDTMSILHEDEEDARLEAEDFDDARIEQVRVLSPTEELERRLGMPSHLDCFDHVLVLWVQDERPDLDGVWWEDSYGPYSAPRGVILPDRLASWRPERVVRFAGLGE